MWTIEDGAYTLEEPTSERNDVDEILYKRIAENDGSDSKVRLIKKNQGIAIFNQCADYSFGMIVSCYKISTV